MGIKEKIKMSIIKNSIEKKKKENPFDENFAENFALPPDAGTDQNNSYYFSCHDAQGRSLLMRLGLRGGGLREIWFAWKDEEGNAFINSQMTDTEGTAQISARCLETALKWEFSFTGKVRQIQKNGLPVTEEPEVNAAFTGIFIASFPIFEFSRHMDAEPMARALAKEKWTRDFQSELAENHQVHYEQHGSVSGTLILGEQTYRLELQAMRDHSFGKRDWSYMNRHIWLMALLPQGGALNVNMVRYPVVQNLQTGYFVENGKTVCMNSVTSMYDLPCTGSVPDVFVYTVELMDGRKFTVNCKKELEFVFPFDDGVYTIHEGIGTFEFGGTVCRGILEFGFNRDQAKWGRK